MGSVSSAVASAQHATTTGDSRRLPAMPARRRGGSTNAQSTITACSQLAGDRIAIVTAINVPCTNACNQPMRSSRNCNVTL